MVKIDIQSKLVLDGSKLRRVFECSFPEQYEGVLSREELRHGLDELSTVATEFWNHFQKAIVISVASLLFSATLLTILAVAFPYALPVIALSGMFCVLFVALLFSTFSRKVMGECAQHLAQQVSQMNEQLAERPLRWILADTDEKSPTRDFQKIQLEITVPEPPVEQEDHVVLDLSEEQALLTAAAE